MTMAADYGYNVFIVLSGIIENLRKQNLTRIREDIDLTKNSNIHWEFIDQVLKMDQDMKKILPNYTDYLNDDKYNNISEDLYTIGNELMKTKRR